VVAEGEGGTDGAAEAEQDKEAEEAKVED